MIEDIGIRWYPGQDCPVRLQICGFVPWEMHGYRGCLLIDGKKIPWAETFVLVCNRFGCDPQKEHVFRRQTITWATRLERVWNDREEW